MVCVIDTHALVWYLEGNKRLSAAARAVLADRDSRLVIPTLVLAEIAHLYACKRIRVDVGRVLSEVANAENCTVYPLDEQIAGRVSGALDIHDSIIVVTALVYGDVPGETVAVVTKDEMIAGSGLVPVIW